VISSPKSHAPRHRAYRVTMGFVSSATSPNRYLCAPVLRPDNVTVFVPSESPILSVCFRQACVIPV
jgi:hypothetical protein